MVMATRTFSSTAAATGSSYQAENTNALIESDPTSSVRNATRVHCSIPPGADVQTDVGTPRWGRL